MDISDARHEKTELETSIAKLITEYEQKTHTRITEIEVERMSVNYTSLEGVNVLILTYVKITVEL